MSNKFFSLNPCEFGTERKSSLFSYYLVFIVICPAGEEIQRANDDACQKCDVGYYKEDVTSLKCSKCDVLDVGVWTKELGTANGKLCLGENLYFSVN